MPQPPETHPHRKRNRGEPHEPDPEGGLPPVVLLRGPTGEGPSGGGAFAVPAVYRDRYGDTSGGGGKDHRSSLRRAIARAFEEYQAVYLPGYAGGGSPGTPHLLRWEELGSVYERLGDADKESLCIEHRFAEEQNQNSGRDGGTPAAASRFLCSKADPRASGYCSFTVQNDTKALSEMLERLPVKDPVAEAEPTLPSAPAPAPAGDKGAAGWSYEPCLWIFFGRNRANAGGNADLEGRPEHTDQISHDGTWHYQLSGTKRWWLRPTPQLLRRWEKERNGPKRRRAGGSSESGGAFEGENEGPGDEDRGLPEPLSIDCREGDVLVVNTRLWKHRTVLPTQPGPSVSYARDFWTREREAPGASKGGTGAMTNVDGLYAADDIEENTVVFTEETMPGCELHRAGTREAANCFVAELEDGTQAVVSSRFIAAGEFFCVPESDDSDGSWGDHDESEDDESGEEQCIVVP